MPATNLWVPLSNMSPFFSTIICVAVNVDVQPSSHSFPMEISHPYWRWDKICDVLDLVYNKEVRFSSSLWFACMRPPSGSSTHGHCIILTLFSHGVSNLMQFYVVPVSVMP